MFFLQFLDGDKTHVSRRNVRPCTLRDVLVHFDEWTIDWERDLTAEEIELVSTTNWVDSVRTFHLGPVPIVASDLRYRVTTRCDDD